ncbi:hypothetical protein F2P81_009485 [Scophthalmus maximus]|uniref:BED-type domain-containing protein n=1 Tax=Scophthalmus maximus TaxID=52904 RepID=A0A6A4T7G0_SCOMX|nr:hypothetical protein F2P81_009485 [Scophthalmus maximus]
MVEIDMATSAVNVDEEDTEDVTTLTASPLVEDDSHPPWTYLATMFGYLGMGENPKTYRMKCLLCLPKCHEVKAFKKSPSNLKKHIERAHPHHLKKYEQLTSKKRKRASEAGTSTLKQTTLLDTRSMSQSAVDRAIVKFHPVEHTFLKEYYTTMSPVAQSINILQGEAEVQMGWLHLTISLLSSKLEKIKIALKHCKPLVEAIQVGIQNCFGEMLRDPELIAAAILIPKFRTAWIKDNATLRIRLDYIREQLEDPSISADVGSGSSDEGDFFHVLKSSHETPSATKQLDSYLTYSTDTSRY